MRTLYRIVGGAALLLGVLCWSAGCSSSRYTSTTTLDFVDVDTSESSGPTVVPVYENYQLGAMRPQQFLPLERPDPSRAGTIREIVTIRTSRPFLERSDVNAEFYGFTMCALGDDESCQPERATIFFTMPVNRGIDQRPNSRAYRAFDRPFDRQFKLQVDDQPVETDVEARYERHGVIWELWIDLPYDTFLQIATAEYEVYFTFGRTDLRFRGRELRPFQAMVAAVNGEATIEDESP